MLFTYTKEEIIKACKESDSKSQMARKLGIKYNNGTVISYISKCIEEYKLNIDHFDRGNNRRIVHKRITRTCPVCKDDFETQDGGKSEKQTCSYSCANTYFRSGKNNGMFKNGDGGSSNYRTICFSEHEKKCIICGEDVIVAVHHYDGNHDNNDPKNLVPLCPTHHTYWHSKHKHLIEETVKEFVDSQ